MLSVNGHQPRDILDWLWWSDGASLTLQIREPSASSTAADAVQPRVYRLQRQPGQSWGISFTDVLFDGLKTCLNACDFCFIRMLPPGLRPALYQQDDDYRLSFLQGNFVTLTNLSEADVRRIIEQRLSPLHVSLHAVDPQIRRQMLGARAPRGLVVLQRLLESGIAVHLQIVLVPGVNDGLALQRTLDWALAQPAVFSVGIVPVAWTRYAPGQSGFSPSAARQLIAELRALAPRVQLADEWFLQAGRPLPAAAYYADYPQYENGIGLVRSFLQDWQSLRRRQPRLQPRWPAAELVSGQAFAPILQKLVQSSPWAENFRVIGVANQFFGGSVNVSGLLTATDLLAALMPRLAELPAATAIILPGSMFNADGLTLDGWTVDQLAGQLGRQPLVLTYAEELFQV